MHPTRPGDLFKAIYPHRLFCPSNHENQGSEKQVFFAATTFRAKPISLLQDILTERHANASKLVLWHLEAISHRIPLRRERVVVIAIWSSGNSFKVSLHH